MTEVEIVNKALLKLGQEIISSFEEKNERAKIANEIFENQRDILLAGHRWAFAVKRVAINEEETAPDFEWSKKYALPTDFLRLTEIYNADFRETDNYEIEGEYILCNYESPLKIKYIARIEKAEAFAPYFCEALACKLAFEFCERLKQDPSRKQTLMQEYGLAISEAKKCNVIQAATIKMPRGSYNDIR